MVNQDSTDNEATQKSVKKEQKYILIQVAMRLFQEQGYGKVKLPHIAKVAGISHNEAKSHFSSEQEICHQVIEAHMTNLLAQFEDINLNGNPRQRLSLYLDSLVEDIDSLITYGCPLTNLYFDVRREDKRLADHAKELLLARLTWIREQFVFISRVKDITDVHERLTSAIHGISILAQVLNSETLIKQQINQLKSWIRSM